MKLKRNGIVFALEGRAAFNCGAVEISGRHYLLARIPHKGYVRRPDGHGFENYVSDIWLVREEKNDTFSLTTEPLIVPTELYEELGCEDPRVSKIGDEYFITYTACSRNQEDPRQVRARIGLASTKDFVHVKKHGIIGPDVNDKDAVLFHDYIGDNVALLHRVEPNIQIAYFRGIDPLTINAVTLAWEHYLRQLDKFTVLRPKFWWEELKIGAGAPPILTDKGWLLIYHGVDKKLVYRAGAALLDRDNPQKVIARSPYPILEPRAKYERIGDVPRVVFPQGALVRNGILHVYYGGADSVCALATCSLNELLVFLMQYA